MCIFDGNCFYSLLSQKMTVANARTSHVWHGFIPHIPEDVPHTLMCVRLLLFRAILLSPSVTICQITKALGALSCLALKTCVHQSHLVVRTTPEGRGRAGSTADTDGDDGNRGPVPRLSRQSLRQAILLLSRQPGILLRGDLCKR